MSAEDALAARSPDPVVAALLRLAADGRLVEQVQAGSGQAFETLFDRHRGPVLALCRRMLTSPEDAEDAMQQTFLDAYSDLVRSETPRRLRPWLYGIARNRCLIMLRARREHPSEQLHRVAIDDVFAELTTREDMREILTDVARLPDDQRAAIVLAKLGGISYDEIARLLACPRQKVKALVFQARSSLAAGRAARETPCGEIREQLATLRGGALRQTSLRRHVRDCPGCRAFRDEVRAGRRRLRLLHPVSALVSLKRAVLGGMPGAGAGGGGAGAGVAVSVGSVSVGGVSASGLAATVLATAAVPVGAVAVAVTPWGDVGAALHTFARAAGVSAVAPADTSAAHAEGERTASEPARDHSSARVRAGASDHDGPPPTEANDLGTHPAATQHADRKASTDENSKGKSTSAMPADAPKPAGSGSPPPIRSEPTPPTRPDPAAPPRTQRARTPPMPPSPATPPRKDLPIPAEHPGASGSPRANGQSPPPAPAVPGKPAAPGTPPAVGRPAPPQDRVVRAPAAGATGGSAPTPDTKPSATAAPATDVSHTPTRRATVPDPPPRAAQRQQGDEAPGAPPLRRPPDAHR